MQIAKPQTRTSREDAQRLVRAFWWVLGVALLPLGAWVATATISSNGSIGFTRCI